MFQELPEFVQKQVLHYLATDNFTAAKALHDAWLRHAATKRKHSSIEDADNKIIAGNFLAKQNKSLIQVLSAAEENKK